VERGVTLGLPELLAIAAALGWASGLRLYAVLFLVGLAGHLGWVPLPGGLSLLAEPWMLVLSGIFCAAEFLVDKVPWLDSAWDVLHTVIRIPAGAALAAAVFGGDAVQWTTAAALLGGTLAATSHAAKTTVRATANTSPEPFSNWGLSLLGDAAVPAMLWLAFEHPFVFWPVLAAVLLCMLVLTAMLWKGVRRLLGALRERARTGTVVATPR
jgi:hypothetical protein